MSWKNLNFRPKSGCLRCRTNLNCGSFLMMRKNCCGSCLRKTVCFCYSCLKRMSCFCSLKKTNCCLRNLMKNSCSLKKDGCKWLCFLKNCLWKVCCNLYFCLKSLKKMSCLQRLPVCCNLCSSMRRKLPLRCSWKYFWRQKTV